MLNRIRKSKAVKVIAVFLVITFFKDVIYINKVFALSGGPSVPEVQSFEPVGTNQMVDLFTGDFTYNIPLFDLPGSEGSYPFNIAYHSGVSMDQEASWVGLGWNLSPGSIDRTVRGFPDDFNGDLYETKTDMNKNTTWGAGVGFGVEGWGLDFGLIGLDILNIGMSVYHNSYRGFGYSLDAGMGVGIGLGSGWSAGLGLGLDLDSQNGATLNADITLDKNHKGTQHSMRFGMGLNSQEGLNYQMNYSSRKDKEYAGSVYNDAYKINEYTGFGSSITFAEKSFSPTMNIETEGNSLSGTLKLLGVDIFGVFPSGNFRFFYNENSVKNTNEEIKTYGYLNLEQPFENGENENNGRYILDFSRSKEDAINENTPNLPYSNLTYDYYNVQGQGIYGMYRPFRSDIGHVHDCYSESIFSGTSINVEYGPGTPNNHFGAGEIASGGFSFVGDWQSYTNPYHDIYKYRDASFAKSMGDYDYEKYYFRCKGDFSVFEGDELDYINGSYPVRIPIPDFDESWTNSGLSNLSSTYCEPDGSDYFVDVSNGLNTSRVNRDRVVRNMSIQEYTHEDLGATGTGSYEELLGEYNVYFYSPDAVFKNDVIDEGYKVSSLMTKKHHVRGITSVNQSGMRYVYGIPAINKEKTDYLFTIDPENAGISSTNANNSDLYIENPDNVLNDETYKVKKSDKFFSRNTTPEYAYAYLLTSILGTDYVDADGTPGPSDGDYGYWVRFNYVLQNPNYNWRVPFQYASYLSGKEFTSSDDKASFSYGQKELWYVASVETNTHIAVFNISERHDGFEPGNTWNINPIIGGSSSYQLNNIKIYEKKEYRHAASPVPIKTINFVYNYSLCQGVDNNDQEGSGKLTLKRIFYTYENNSRGQYNDYEFTYNSYNPDYDANKYDRWGGYKSSDNGFPSNKTFPFVTQFNRGVELQTESEKQVFQDQKDEESSAWLLKTIKLPSGGTIEVDYESDDYGFVQHKQAMQMFMIEGIQTWGANSVNVESNPGIGQLKIYFKLENPIPTTEASPNEVMRRQYLEALKIDDYTYQLYFNVKSKIMNSIHEQLEGYSELNMENGYYGVDNIEQIDGQNCYTRGYFTLKPRNLEDKDGNDRFHHPFAAAAFLYLRTTAPELLATPELEDDDPDTDVGKAIRVANALSILNSLKLIFKDYLNYCVDKEHGNQINLNQSWVRLGSPDFKKYGGGTRVKKIVVNDNWDSFGTDGTNRNYGVVYDYTRKTSLPGEIISSGVATYEPLVGGQEIPLRYAKEYPRSLPFRSPNYSYFEYPINESYFPGPSVGYSQVTVRSLATDNNINNLFPAGIDPITTGQTVNEFYTCRDFPVIVDETPIKTNIYNHHILIPFIGQVTENKLNATQGYSIKLNDMHGKPKSIKQYAQREDGTLITNESGIVSSQQFIYKSKPVFYDHTGVNELENEYIKLMNDDKETGSNNQTITDGTGKVLGVEYEFFTDMKRAESVNGSCGVYTNVELITLLPIPIVIPSYYSSEKELSTISTNKIIHKSGILTDVITSDGQSVVAQKNEVFDIKTGKPVITSVKNFYDNKVFKFETPAFYEYSQMGHAYKNWKLEFLCQNITPITVSTNLSSNLYSVELYTNIENEIDYNSIKDLLVPGDKASVNGSSVATYIGERKNSEGNEILVFYSDQDIEYDLSDYPGIDLPKFKILQSGNKNQLEDVCGVLTYLDDGVNGCNPFIREFMSNGYINDIADQDNPTYSLAGTYETCFVELLNGINDYIKNRGDKTFSLGSGACKIIGNVKETITMEYSGDFFNVVLSDDVNNIQKIKINKVGTDLGYGQYDISILYNGKEKDLSSVHINGTYPVSLLTNDYHPISSFDFNKIVKGDTKTYMKLKNRDYVLDISAVTYSDARINDTMFIDQEEGKFIYNPFKTGERGIWKPEESFALTDIQRSGPWNSSGINYENFNRNSNDLSTAGVYENEKDKSYSLFDWQHYETGSTEIENSQYYNGTSWETWTVTNFKSKGKVTKYNCRGKEIENCNILGLYSAALYGYTDYLQTALASNARYSEIGFESFEDYDLTTSATLLKRGMKSGNIEVYHTKDEFKKYTSYDILYGLEDKVIINKKWNADDVSNIVGSYIKVATVAGEFNSTESDENIVKRSNDFSVLYVNECTYAAHGYTALKVSSPYDNCKLKVFSDNSNGAKRPWKGKVGIITNTSSESNPYSQENFVISNSAHSGKQSLMVESGNTVTFKQNILNLEAGKKYIFNAWIKCGNSNIDTYKNDFNDYIKVICGATTYSLNSNSYKTQLIEGWQLVQLEFTALAGQLSIQLNSLSGDDVYFDDIRIFPSDANINSYVYNKTNYRLMATLDNNHFATFYYYDTEGNLFLVKKETERGIKTIKETRNYLKEEAYAF